MKAGIAEAVAAEVTDTHVVVSLSNGRETSTPLAWYPSLMDASPAARNRIEISPFGLHWPDLDEDLSVGGMLKGMRSSAARP